MLMFFCFETHGKDNYISRATTKAKPTITGIRNCRGKKAYFNIAISDVILYMMLMLRIVTVKLFNPRHSYTQPRSQGFSLGNEVELHRLNSNV